MTNTADRSALPDDFMMQALATPRDGKSSVLGYRVYSRVR
jgi:hypothetical protein